MTLSLPSLRRCLAGWMACGLHWTRVAFAEVPFGADYKFEFYAEEAGRTRVSTQAASVEAWLNESVSVKGDFIYDAISGATPLSGLPNEGSTQVPLVELRDTRRAGQLEFTWQGERQRLKPLFAYSLESDYESISPALNWEIDFNRRNTTLLLGVAANWDGIFAATLNGRTEDKRTSDFLVGITQVLGPSTVISANLTLGMASGFLADPYKRVRFDLAPDGVLELERRPRHRSRQVIDLTLRQYVEPLQGNAEFGYRFYHDSFGIFGHTASGTWFQKMGKRWVVSPTVRYYRQTGAAFFATQFAGDPSNPFLTDEFPVPDAYSSDYRLSRLHTWTYGVGITVQVARHWHLNVAYKRYEMIGDDRMVASSNFPVANVYTLGLRLVF